MMLLLAALAGPIRVAFIGRSFEAPDLASLVGRGYDVHVFQTLDQMGDFHPSFVITGVDSRTPAREVDQFVPNLKKALAEVTGLAGHPKVLLRLPPTDSDFDRQVLRPLTIQAARESGVPTYDSPTHTTMGYAEELFFLVVDWKAVKAGWKVVSVDSEQVDEGPAKDAIDGDPDTYWHTEYSPVTAQYPHEIVIDTGESKLIGGFRYLPRQDGGTNGRVKGYEFLVSLDGEDWSAATLGEFPNERTASMVVLKSAVRARFIKFRALSEQSGEPYASMAELDVLPAKFSVP
jgi:hypothetical protein